MYFELTACNNKHQKEKAGKLILPGMI